MRRLAGMIAGALAAILAVGPARAADFSPAPWLQDLAQLRDAMSARYANLQWQAARGLDLPGTYARAEGRLARARDEFQARRAIDRFLEAFGDGHVEIAWPAPAATPAAKTAPSPLCDRLGYADAGDDGAVATRLAGFRAVGAPGGVLRAGLVEAGGKRVGVLRLPIFSPQGFRAICDRVAAQQSLTPQSACDEACEDRFSRRANGVFVGEMQAAVAALKAAGAEVLLVDIAGNGGGDDSAILLARLLTARAMPTPRVGFLRTPAWAAELESRRADIRAGLAKAAGAERDVLLRYDAALATAAAEAAKPCDLSPLWRGQPGGCSAVVTGVLFAGGLSPNLPPPPRDRPWSETISAESRFPAIGTAWRGPVIVLVDGDSASSSEMFAAMMQDRHAAVILGSPTFGAGCGHMTGRDPVVLRNSGARVSLPDCVRLRADGSNEVAGVEPDVLIGFKTHDTAAERTTRLARKLPLAIARATGRR
jgi:hypothetical protein